MGRKNKKTKSVGNGEGTLYKSETLNCWVFQYHEPSGKRKTLKQRKHESAKDFKIRVTKIKNDINMNTYIEDNDTSLYKILKDYIENKYATGITSERTYSRDSDNLKLLEKCCKSYIYKPIQKVTTADIKKSLPNLVKLEIVNPKTNETTVKIYSQNIIDKLYMFLNKGFKIATSERIIQFNLMENESIKKPKSKKETEKVKALTLDEEKKLISVLKNSDHKYKDIILLSLFIGTRIGETLAITRDNINLKENTITIEKTLTRGKNYKTILGNKTKTEAGKREIYLTDNAKLILKEILKSNITNMYNLIFFDYKKSTFITPNEINCFLQRLNEKEKICKHIHTHMLRHTYATRCIEAGMSAKVLQKNLGHKKIQTTLDTYTTVFNKFNINENEKYNQYMKEMKI